MPPASTSLGRNRKERRLLRGLYAGVLFLLLLLLLVTFRTFDRYSHTNRNIRQNNAVLHEIESMVSALKDAQIGVRGFILTHDTSYILPFRIAQPAVEQSIRRLDSLRQEAGTNLDFSMLSAESRQLLKVIQEQFLSERSSSIGLQGDEMEQLVRGRDLMEKIRAEQRRVGGETEHSRDGYLVAERTLQPDTPLMLLVYSGMALLATAILFWRLFRALDKAEQAETETQHKVELLNKEVRTREFAERSLKRVLDSSPDAIMAFRSIRDRLGRIMDFEWVLANQASEREHASNGTGLIGKHLLVEFPQIKYSGLFDAYVQVVESGMPYEVERPSSKEGGKWVHLHALRLLDGFVVTVADISENRRAMQLVAESDRLAITGGIARTIAHEVRNPLTNLHMALEQLLEELGPEKAAEVSTYSDILQRNMHRISKLINDLLETSKPRELHKVNSKIEDLFADAVAAVQDRIDLLEMKIETEIAPDTVEVMADPEMLTVALTNLCINAIEAMKVGEGLLRLSSKTEQGHVRLRVEDNGKGIAQENIKHLFQAFYSGRTGGMGLGLTSARTILNAHGVHVDVESEVGVGTRFSLTFPE